MARTPSNMIPLGSAMPTFSLPDPRGAIHSSGSLTGSSGTLVLFVCNHCPYVIHLAHAFGDFARAYAPRGLSVVAINANDPEAYPDDAPDRMEETARAFGWDFPYLFDASQETARAFDAACTPDLYLYDAGGRLVYRGQFDGSRPGNSVPVTGEDLRRAVEALLAGVPLPANQLPSVGCNIKWRPGTRSPG